MWEDLGNKDGGKWVLTVKDDEHLLDKIWEELVSSLSLNHVCLDYECVHVQWNSSVTG